MSKMLKITAAVAAPVVAMGLMAAPASAQSRDRDRDDTARNALIGAAVGGLAGAIYGNGDGRYIAGGALGGAAVGQYMDRQQRAMEAELSGSGVGVARQGDNLVLRMPSDVTFATNQSSIDPRFLPVLDDVARVLQEYDRSTIDVIGHTDSTGGDAINQPLSERRAASVASELVRRGVIAERLYVAGNSSRNPVASNATPEGKAQNRRVEILIRPFTG